MIKELHQRGTDMQHEIAVEAAKASPALGGTIYYYFTMNEWVGLLTAIYILVQMAFLIHKWFWAIQDRRIDKKQP